MHYNCTVHYKMLLHVLKERVTCIKTADETNEGPSDTGV